MSIQIHCDNCDDSLVKVGPNQRLVDRVEHTVIQVGDGENWGGVFPDSRRDFCDYDCLSRWARKQPA